MSTDQGSRKTGSTAAAAQRNTNGNVSKALRLLPHITTAIVGFIALADLLEKYGPDTAQMITNVINQLYAFTPDNVNSAEEINPGLLAWLLSLLGYQTFKYLMNGGLIGIIILLGSFVLSLAVALESKRPSMILFFPIALQIYCFLLKWVLLGVFYFFGGLLSVVTAFVCFLASIFVGVKVLASLLEVYHGAKSAEEIANALRENRKGTG